MNASRRIPILFVVAIGLCFLLAQVSIVAAGSKSDSTKKKTTQKPLTVQKKKVEKQKKQVVKKTPKAAVPKGKININKAGLDTLTQLKGIGPEKAKAIMAYRRKVGSFKKIEDLMQVKGIGEKTFKAIKPFIKVK